VVTSACAPPAADGAAARACDATWRGGRMLAASDAFAGRWITKQQYDEVGGTIVHQRCF
jgi:actin-related protein